MTLAIKHSDRDLVACCRFRTVRRSETFEEEINRRIENGSYYYEEPLRGRRSLRSPDQEMES